MRTVTAMMAGTVVDLLVTIGDRVNEGMEVAVLESMKMQLPIQSTWSGTVKEVKVKAGDFVNQDDPILVIE
jgi:acetyl-CoA carboxylase biotin carboxyl carrier protein